MFTTKYILNAIGIYLILATKITEFMIGKSMRWNLTETKSEMGYVGYLYLPKTIMTS